ncbi:hypothetical protein Y1Q_0020806 [Alligator mississippiensis]|uniref:Uncharacterized protein n=1 Tax=Alligator mississippiensis TaxID=8496 RepID=A0A151P052_ALLMI|nr:hypothetical protein Y1Q_0020806 [Alligator mississippiensis]
MKILFQEVRHQGVWEHNYFTLSCESPTQVPVASLLPRAGFRFGRRHQRCRVPAASAGAGAGSGLQEEMGEKAKQGHHGRTLQPSPGGRPDVRADVQEHRAVRAS